MRLRFTTSIATARGYFHEGRVIEVESVPPEFKEWIRTGAVVVVTPPDTLERAIAGEDEREEAVSPQRRRVRPDRVAR